MPTSLLCTCSFIALTLMLTACGGSGSIDPVVEESPLPSVPRLCSAVAPSSIQPVAHIPALATLTPDWTARHVAGRVLILEDQQGLVAQNLRALSGVRIQRISSTVILAFTPTGQADQAFAAHLSAAGMRVQPDFVYSALGTPNDPAFPGNSGLLVDEPTLVATLTQTYLTRVNAAAAWSYLESCGKTPVGAVTAIIDSGIDGQHPDLEGRLLPGKSFLETPADIDEFGHGTGVAGLVGAATNNGMGVSGMTWAGRNLLSLKALNGSGNTRTSELTRALQAAVDKEARVINMSFGIAGNPGDTVLDEALTAAGNAAVLVAAAGNTSGDGVYYPASHPLVVAVGAVGNSDTELACYSARPVPGHTRMLDLVAPGGAGEGYCPDALEADDLLVLAPNDNYLTTAGTSEAAPLVSGVAALMRAANPALTAEQTRTLLIASAKASGGLPLLDAGAAVRAALGD